MQSPIPSIVRVFTFLITACVLVTAYTNCGKFGLSLEGGNSTSASTSNPGSVGTVPGRIALVGDYERIDSNFDRSVWTWDGSWDPKNCAPGADGGAKPDVVGAFRFQCNPSHNGYNDPIVYPGRSGASHLHTFFGNTLTDANSTYESLRLTGDSSCDGGPLNRSGYWIPSMMNGKNQVVMPDFITVYYKRRPKSDPECQRQGKECVEIPRGLRMIFGYNMAKAKDAEGQAHAYWKCEFGHQENGMLGHETIAEARCPVGERIGHALSAPDCWDGVHLDSPDHRSHLSYGSYGSWGYYKCPDTHPYVIPDFTIGAWYSHTGPEETKDWFLSSDRMAGMPALGGGSSFHTDWFGAWDEDIMKEWQDHAIDKLMNCSAGNMGSGRSLIRRSDFYWENPNRLQNPPVMSFAQKLTQEASMKEMAAEHHH